MSKRVSAEAFADAIIEALSEYSQEITEETKEIAKDISSEAVSEVKKGSPVRKGKYKKGWKKATVFENSQDIRIAVHNEKHYQLTHLLENGHLSRNGKRVKPVVHIAPVEDRISKEFNRRVEILVKK